MQNNEQSSSGAFRKFFQEKGYYIVLFLCILAVGISGYIFIKSAVSEKNSLSDETLSVATTTTVPQPGQTASPSAPAAGTQDAAASAGTEAELPESSVPASTPVTDDEVRETASSIRVAPISGTEVLGYSMDKLSYNPTTRDWRTHDGVDLSAVSGTPVKAACAGTVSAVYDDEFLGTTVVISHSDGHATHYANLAASPTVRTGDSVSAGDVIGAVGDTALLETGEEPHLHFAVYLNGTPVDPAEYLS